MKITNETMGYTIQFENRGKRGMIGTWEPTLPKALVTVRRMAENNGIITLTRIWYKDRMKVKRVVKPHEYNKPTGECKVEFEIGNM